MTVAEFLRWAEDRPGRHELVDGRVYAMAPERVRHARVKFALHKALDAAIGRARLPCELLPNGIAVPIDDATTFEPDALVRCGSPLPGDAMMVTDPMIVVEVLSPSTRRYDLGGKLARYFALPTLRHYLIVDPAPGKVIHHRRDQAGEIATRILGRGGVLRLDPPGLEVAVEDLIPIDP